MIKHIYKIAFFALLIISCTNDENSGNENNLLEISKKLNALDPSVIGENNDSQMNAKKISKKKNSQQKTSIDCQHTETYTENYNGMTYTSTISYFDENMNPATNCIQYSEDSFLQYYTKESQITTGPDFEYNMNSTGSHTEEFTSNLVELTSSQSITGTLNFDGSIFNILEGSYFNLFISYDSTTFSEEFEPQIDIKYIFEFDANNTTYHFEMIVNYQDLMDPALYDESELTMDYPLFDATNTQIGIITYVSDFETEKEYFRLYDLDGNLIE